MYKTKDKMALECVLVVARSCNCALFDIILHVKQGFLICHFLINCIVYTRLWYLAHVYPWSLSYANKIKSLTFHYLWGKKCEPIRSNTLTFPKHKGGLGIIDIYYKSRSILTSSFIKYYNNENVIKCMIDYYNNVRFAQLLNLTSDPQQVSYIGTEYYR